MSNKYGAKSFFKDDVFWASKWEYKVWCELRNQFPTAIIRTQVSILLKPKTENFPPIYWRCDFELEPTNGYPNLLLEAKGVRTSEFTRTLKYLDYFNPESFKKVRVIGDHPIERITAKYMSATLPDVIKEIKLAKASQ